MVISKFLSRFAAIFFILCASLQCSDIYDVSKAEGLLTVFVHFNDFPIAGKKVELIRTGETKQTNDEGKAEFRLLPGDYTIRVYDINRGGPCCAYVDFDVDIKPSESQLLKVYYCLPCA